MRSVLAVLALSTVAVLAAPQATTTASAAAATHSVDVGLNGFAYTPNSITAAAGDIVQFTFHPKNHTVTQSSFASPCTPLVNATTGQTGFESPFMPTNGTAPLPTLEIMVTNATNPLWFYCRQANHCSLGMVLAINAPATGHTFTAFQAAAMASNGTAAAGSSTAAAASSAAAGTPVAGAPPTDSSGASSTDSTGPAASAGAPASNTTASAPPTKTGAAPVLSARSGAVLGAALAAAIAMLL